jgi:hypothetical protein
MLDSEGSNDRDIVGAICFNDAGRKALAILIAGAFGSVLATAESALSRFIALEAKYRQT